MKFGASERDTVIGEVHCIGTELELLECSHDSIGIHRCGGITSTIPDLVISCFGKYLGSHLLNVKECL